MHIKTLRAGAFCLTALLTALTAGIGCFADTDENDIIFPADEQEEIETFVSGDYTYSVMVGAEDETLQAACIESYDGTEAELVIPSELDGLEVVMLGDYAFSSSSTLTSVTLPATVVGLGTFTFANCTNITAFYVEEGNPYFESIDGVLYGDDGKYLARYPIGSHPGDIVIPDGVTAVGNVAFACSKSLSSVTFPESVAYIGNSAFADCTGLTAVTIPQAVTTIEPFTFNSCANLKDVTLHDEITEIGNAAFAGTAIASITIPAACTTIGQQAFADTDLTEITIPSTVTSIGYSAFGWKLNAYGELYMDDAFIVRGESNSTAQLYASDTENENSFTFIATDITDDSSANDGSSGSSDETDEPVIEELPEQSISTGRIIGIVLSCVLILAIIVIAVVTSVRDREKPKKS